ncbi:MAG TPA: D-alanyl-lipoteichoic acid biosynthesis protein DltB [Eggerthellaceae bacterium]|nr:D-alanyl-lipoteichoic acid biosynthesis protein DltB [Eggerthellaceae bacterium]
MGFYTEPAFFILLGIAVVPAIVLGCLEKRIRLYGFAVSLVFVALLFMHSLQEAAALAFFLVLSFVMQRWVLHLFRKESPHAVGLYRVALALTIAPLVVYKVGAVFDANILGFLGISYMTFKAAQVLIEIRDGLITKLSVLDFFYFLLFFPSFTTGPIMRSRAFVEDVDAPLPRAEYLDRLALGALRFLAGAVYKFVLASLAYWAWWFVPQAIGYATPAAAVASELCIAVLYAAYLFFDFAGYSFMAMGAGAAFGVNVPRNFKFPFLAQDVKDFWNRWHMTLTFWLRDFVFMRMTKALIKRRVFKSRVTTACVGFVFIMTLMGCWNGLTFDYVSCGVFFGLAMAATELFQRKSKLYRNHKKDAWFKFVSWLLTMVWVLIGLSFFSGQIGRLIFGG